MGRRALSLSVVVVAVSWGGGVCRFSDSCVSSPLFYFFPGLCVPLTSSLVGHENQLQALDVSASFTGCLLFALPCSAAGPGSRARSRLVGSWRPAGCRAWWYGEGSRFVVRRVRVRVRACFSQCRMTRTDEGEKRRRKTSIESWKIDEQVADGWRMPLPREMQPRISSQGVSERESERRRQQVDDSFRT